MREFADIERRIERLCSPAALQQRGTSWVAEMGDVLALGYVSAYRADARIRQLGERLHHLLENVNHPRVADEVRQLAQERRTIDEATRRLRKRLAVARSLLVRVGARPDLV